MMSPLKFKVKSKEIGKRTFEYHANFADQTDAVNYACDLSKHRLKFSNVAVYTFAVSGKVYCKFCQGNMININQQLGRLT